jgi:hypothetical protein
MNSPWEVIAMIAEEKNSRRYACLFIAPRLPKPQAKLGSAGPQNNRKF